MENKTKQFQYEVQQYQENCVNNIISIFEKLHQKEDFTKIIDEALKSGGKVFIDG